MTTTATHLSNEQLAACQQLHDHLVRTGPDHFNMGTWLEVNNNEFMLNEAARFSADVFDGDCGTRACIAGHAIVLFDPADYVAAEARLPKHLQTSADIGRWGQQSVIENVLIELLGMNVQVPIDWHSMRDWFGSSWPLFAQTIQRAHYLRSVAAWGDEQPLGWHEAHADHATVVQVLDELVHGVRRHWWDGDILTAEQEAELARQEHEQEMLDECEWSRCDG
jgi:hypothetical protein